MTKRDFHIALLIALAVFIAGVVVIIESIKNQP